MSNPLVHVAFDWSDEFGVCYDCGLPAAYRVESSYESLQGDAALRCSVCAAMAASEGEPITYLFADNYAPVGFDPKTAQEHGL